jgi:hypothetical protein
MWDRDRWMARRRTGLRLSVEVRLFWVVASIMMFVLCIGLGLTVFLG